MHEEVKEMRNQIIIAEALGGSVRIHAVDTTDIVEEARKLHHCMPTSAAALGRTLTVTAIMGSDLKNSYEKVTCIFNGHGPAGTVLAQADGSGKCERALLEILQFILYVKMDI